MDEIIQLLKELKTAQAELKTTQENFGSRLQALEEQSTNGGSKQGTIISRLTAQATATDAKLDVFGAKIRELEMARFDPVSKRVAAIPELVEMILHQLSFHDLLVNAQRVNKHFKSIIDTSKPLQRKLFFLPEHNPGEANLGDINVNLPFLTQGFFVRQKPHMHGYGLCFGIQDRDHLLPVTVDKGAGSRSIIVHLEKEQCACDELGSLEFSTKRHPDGTVCDLQRRGLLKGSWQRMYLTQPPVKVVWDSGDRKTRTQMSAATLGALMGMT